jgi:hypothetical protein
MIDPWWQYGSRVAFPVQLAILQKLYQLWSNIVMRVLWRDSLHKEDDEQMAVCHLLFFLRTFNDMTLFCHDLPFAVTLVQILGQAKSRASRGNPSNISRSFIEAPYWLTDHTVALVLALCIPKHRMWRTKEGFMKDMNASRENNV